MPATRAGRRRARSPAPNLQPADIEPFECTICMHVLLSPVTIRCCGCSVCRHCLVRHIESAVRQTAARCPACGSDSRLTREDVGVPSVALQGLLARDFGPQIEQRRLQLSEENMGAGLDARIAQRIQTWLGGSST